MPSRAVKLHVSVNLSYDDERRIKMETIQKLLRIAGIGLAAAAIIFTGLALLGYQKTWMLPAALGCNSMALLFQIICRQQSKQQA